MPGNKFLIVYLSVKTNFEQNLPQATQFFYQTFEGFSFFDKPEI